MTEGRPRDTERDRRIIDATRSLLDSGGLDAVSVTAVARQAGVGRPTVYRRYANANDLAMAVLHDDLDDVIAQLQTLPLPSTDPLDLLVEIASHPLRYFAANPSRSRSLLQLSLFAPPVWAERFEHQVVGFIGWVATRLAECQRQGTLRAEVDLMTLVQSFYGLYLATAIGACSERMGPIDTQIAVLRQVLDQHLIGLRTLPESPG